MNKSDLAENRRGEYERLKGALRALGALGPGLCQFRSSLWWPGNRTSPSHITQPEPGLICQRQSLTQIPTQADLQALLEISADTISVTQLNDAINFASRNEILMGYTILKFHPTNHNGQLYQPLFVGSKFQQHPGLSAFFYDYTG